MGGVFQFFPVIGMQSKQQFHQCIKMQIFPLCIQTQSEQKIYIYIYKWVRNEVLQFYQSNSSKLIVNNPYGYMINDEILYIRKIDSLLEIITSCERYPYLY